VEIKEVQSVFHERNRPKAYEDIALLEPSEQELLIYGHTKNLEDLALVQNLKTLWVEHVNQQELERILSYVQPLYLYIYNLKIENLGCLEKLTDVKVLQLEWNTKATTLWDITKNKELVSLTIRDFSRLTHINELERALHIEMLKLEGGNTNPLRLETLQSLACMHNLRYLGLSNLKVADESLAPLSKLTKLEVLELSNQFPTEEYAKLSVMLPHTSCEKFHVYTRLHFSIGPKNIMITGKRKPMLNEERDKEKIAKYEQRFSALQEVYRKEFYEIKKNE